MSDSDTTVAGPSKPVIKHESIEKFFHDLNPSNLQDMLLEEGQVVWEQKGHHTIDFSLLKIIGVPPLVREVDYRNAIAKQAALCGCFDTIEDKYKGPKETHFDELTKKVNTPIYNSQALASKQGIEKYCDDLIKSIKENIIPNQRGLLKIVEFIKKSTGDLTPFGIQMVKSNLKTISLGVHHGNSWILPKTLKAFPRSMWKNEAENNVRFAKANSRFSNWFTDGQSSTEIQIGADVTSIVESLYQTLRAVVSNVPSLVLYGVCYKVAVETATTNMQTLLPATTKALEAYEPAAEVTELRAQIAEFNKAQREANERLKTETKNSEMLGKEIKKFTAQVELLEKANKDGTAELLALQEALAQANDRAIKAEKAAPGKDEIVVKRKAWEDLQGQTGVPTGSTIITESELERLKNIETEHASHVCMPEKKGLWSKVKSIFALTKSTGPRKQDWEYTTLGFILSPFVIIGYSIYLVVKLVLSVLIFPFAWVGRKIYRLLGFGKEGAA